jgi:hypothetical protein
MKPSEALERHRLDIRRECEAGLSFVEGISRERFLAELPNAPS